MSPDSPFARTYGFLNSVSGAIADAQGQEGRDQADQTRAGAESRKGRNGPVRLRFHARPGGRGGGGGVAGTAPAAAATGPSRTARRTYRRRARWPSSTPPSCSSSTPRPDEYYFATNGSYPFRVSPTTSAQTSPPPPPSIAAPSRTANGYVSAGSTAMTSWGAVTTFPPPRPTTRRARRFRWAVRRRNAAPPRQVKHASADRDAGEVLSLSLIASWKGTPPIVQRLGKGTEVMTKHLRTLGYVAVLMACFWASQVYAADVGGRVAPATAPPSRSCFSPPPRHSRPITSIPPGNSPLATQTEPINRHSTTRRGPASACRIRGTRPDSYGRVHQPQRRRPGRTKRASAGIASASSCPPARTARRSSSNSTD